MYQMIITVGYLGRDPEMRYTPAGQAVTNFNVATNRQYTGSDGNQVKETTWFRVSVWGKQAEACNQYLKKGSKVLVEGRLISDPKTGGPRIWQGQSGPGASFEINASTVRFLSNKDESAEEEDAEEEHGNNNGNNASRQVPKQTQSAQVYDDIPF
jgi:single-strand DNA-binding protein